MPRAGAADPRGVARAFLPAHDAHVVCLDAAWPAIARQPATVPRVALHPQNIAYVAYTRLDGNAEGEP